VDEALSDGLEPGQRTFLVNAHQAAIPGDIRRKHCPSLRSTRLPKANPELAIFSTYQSMCRRRPDRLITVMRRNWLRRWEARLMARCRVRSSVAPRNPRIGDDPDTTACSPLPDCALPGTPPIWSKHRIQHGSPRPCGRHTAYDPPPRGL